MKIHNNIKQWTDEWLELRKWVITWTKLKSVLSWPAAQLTQMYELLAEIYINEEPLNAYEIIERWHELEPIAKAKYEEITGEFVTEVWFVTKYDWLWLSPDGLIKNWDTYNKAIEIKCPRWKNYIKYLLEDTIPKEYKSQIINYFIVMDDLEELDFIIYNPDVSVELKSLHIINITRENLKKDIEWANKKIEVFKKGWDELKNTLIKKEA